MVDNCYKCGEEVAEPRNVSVGDRVFKLCQVCYEKLLLREQELAPYIDRVAKEIRDEKHSN